MFDKKNGLPNIAIQANRKISWLFIKGNRMLMLDDAKVRFKSFAFIFRWINLQGCL
jgi:hypothetical protein